VDIVTTYLFPLLAFVTMISIIVIIHEWGHYRAGRLFGLIGTHFSLGFGPKLVGWTDRRGTEWRLSPFLIGGYVRFPGDDDKNPVPEGTVTLQSLKRWQRAVVVGAGPGINIVLAIALFSLIAGVWGYPVGRPIVQSVEAGSPASTAGMAEGDVIRTIDGNRIVTGNDVSKNVMLHPGRATTVVVDRGGREESFSFPIGRREFVDDDGNRAEIGYLGVKLPTVYERAGDPITAVVQGTSDGVFLTYAQLESLRQMVSGQRSVTELSGPIKIARASAKAMSFGLMPFVYLMAMISIAVAVMNLLPIPGLDGGHLATYAVEGVMRRDLPEKFTRRLVQCGLGLIVCLSVFAFTLDIVSLT
jgi:regulator of sigma E protease